MNHWLVKSEPEAYSFAQFTRDKTTAWTGVRNYAARNFLKAMEKGDEVFFYHSVSEKAVVGLATVIKTAHPDPTVEPDEKGDWVCVDFKAVRALARPVALDEIKRQPALKNIPLLRQSRLSVMPLTATEAAAIKQLGQG
ncbi:MAG: EVE domain-containing protein [Methylacidiphilales bacterium]|nr:EVE domain-containing protein [Candidatus Methylacidiphilales bacterium]